ncbi:MAG: hypothetical protein JWN90_681 [Parcubacteria group bacterium]|nr:hypothetical protein [Parcubacteria group bacterium]
MNIGTYHLHLRKRVYTDKEPYPHTDRTRRYFDILMYGVSIAAPFALLPQVIHIYLYRTADGLSLSTWALLGLINLLWVGYGVLHRANPIIITNFGMMILNFAIVVGIFMFP